MATTEQTTGTHPGSSHANDCTLLPDALLGHIRERFHYVEHCPYAGKRIFLENAGGSLTLKSVVQRTADIAAIPDNEHRDNPASQALSEIVNQGRKDLTTFFGASNGTLFGGETGTECLFRIIRTAALNAPAGGNMIACEIEHPATFDASAQWADRTQREWIRIPFDAHTGRVTATDYATHVRPDTRIATILHTSPITGQTMDIGAIAHQIRRIAPECFIIVDGIQHAPHGYLEIDDYDVDAYVVSLYKAFCRFNNGYAWLSERLNTIDHDRLLSKPKDAWELGSRDPSALAGASAVIDYLDWLGSHVTTAESRRERLIAAGTAIREHEQALIHWLLNGRNGLKGLTDYPQVRLIGEKDSPYREGVVSFEVQNMDAKQLVSRLGERGIRVHARSNDVFSGNILRPLSMDAVTRISVAHYNSITEIDTCLSVLSEILESA
ncbi:aminotransferase class V-fold PLP-dependent enzyme [Aidingimonas lacisalsi]|uniref:aminotransferase class V-fold PLP-dependent enzyme n=1 Tax=Aidingimonas lacisalsi TaxID=2604086 RepID=UPI001F35A6AD|nr:aminotransferase class V-fold PLP-dependent enzyme [Aidingimonas lacisalsi]